eukprot:Nk52_evm8s295 gene=Nk52_evmTU8s295
MGVLKETDIERSVKERLQEAFDSLSRIWDDIGLDVKGREQRTADLADKMEKLCSELISKEQERRKTLLAEVARASKELDEIADVLSLTYEQPNSDLALVERHDFLLIELEYMQKEYVDRLSTIQRMQKDIIKLRKILGISGTPADDSLDDVGVIGGEEEGNHGNDTTMRGACDIAEMMKKGIDISKTRISRMKLKISTYKGERERKEEEICPLLDEALELRDKLDFRARCTFEKCVFLGMGYFELTDESKKKIEDLISVLKGLCEEREQTVVSLKSKINVLWTKLELPKAELKSLYMECSGLSDQSLQRLETEIDRLEELKKTHMQKFIDNTRAQLNVLWDKCYFDDCQRARFRPAFDDLFDEASLQAHENEVEKLTRYFETNKEILKLVDKREKIREKIIQFELNSQDPSRLSNRGGRLLQEEKIRNMVNKELPKLESKIEQSVSEWEKTNGQYFLVKGKRYVDVIRQQSEESKNKKEKERLEREKAKMKPSRAAEPTPNTFATPRKSYRPQTTCSTSKKAPLRKAPSTPSLSTKALCTPARKVSAPNGKQQLKPEDNENMPPPSLGRDALNSASKIPKAVDPPKKTTTRKHSSLTPRSIVKPAIYSKESESLSKKTESVLFNNEMNNGCILPYDVIEEEDGNPAEELNTPIHMNPLHDTVNLSSYSHFCDEMNVLSGKKNNARSSSIGACDFDLNLD